MAVAESGRAGVFVFAFCVGGGNGAAERRRSGRRERASERREGARGARGRLGEGAIVDVGLRTC